MSNTDNTPSPIRVSFAALDPYLEISIPEPVQKERSGKRYIPYGVDNLYPQYLLTLYETCSTLQAIIDGNVNYVMGDDVTVTGDMDKEKTIEALTEAVRDYYIFGYAFLQVRKNALGGIYDIIHLPAEFIRTDKEHQIFLYSEKWDRGGSQKAAVYPLFMRESQDSSGIVMIGRGRGTYPAPRWRGAIKDVEIERNIEEFHLSELQNNFLSSAIVNFNNGVPADTEKAEIEQNMQEKFSGSSNGGRMMLCFNNNVQNRTTVERLSSDNFDTRYQALASRSREQIFISFKAQPILFGLTSETNTGFSTQEFGDLFRLYNKTMISPVQDMLRRVMAHIYGADVIKITPFAL